MLFCHDGNTIFFGYNIFTLHAVYISVTFSQLSVPWIHTARFYCSLVSEHQRILQLVTDRVWIYKLWLSRQTSVFSTSDTAPLVVIGPNMAWLVASLFELCLPDVTFGPITIRRRYQKKKRQKTVGLYWALWCSRTCSAVLSLLCFPSLKYTGVFNAPS